MANIEHANLTGAALHEPKGVATAVAGQVYVADGLGSGSWSSLTATIPVGTVCDFAGPNPPVGWLLCYGQAVSRSTYSVLFSVLGTVYGAGNGSTTFNLPDLRDLTTVGKGNMGGSTRGLISGAVSGINSTTLGSSGGTESQILTEAQMPAHNHSGLTSSANIDHVHNFTAVIADNPTATATNAGGSVVSSSNEQVSVTGNMSSNTTHDHSFTTSTRGGTDAVNNMQPSIIINKIIYTGV